MFEHESGSVLTRREYRRPSTAQSQYRRAEKLSPDLLPCYPTLSTRLRMIPDGRSKAFVWPGQLFSKVPFASPRRPEESYS